MPKKRETVRVIERVVAPKESSNEEFLQQLEDGVSPEEMEANERLAEFQDQFGGKDYKIRVELFDKESAEWKIVPQSFKLDGFDPIQSLRAYGGGRYRLRLLNEKGRYVTGGSQEIHMAAAILPPEPEKPKSALEDPIFQMLMTQMQADKAAFMELLKTLAAKPSENPKPPSITELIASVAQLKQLGPSDEGGMKNIKQMAELMTLLKDLNSSENSGGEGWLNDIGQAMKFAKEAGLLNRGGHALPSAPQVPSPAPAPIQRITLNPAPMPKAATNEVEEMNPISEGVKKYIPIFLARAQRNADCNGTALFLIEELEDVIVPLICKHYRPGGLSLTPEFVLQHLIDKSDDAAEVQKIFDFAPELAPYKEWVKGVIAEAVKELTTEEKEQENAELVSAV